MRVIVEARGRVRDAHLVEQPDRPLARLVLVHVQVAAQGLRDLRADRQRRVQRRHRVLEDHRDLLAADVLELRALELQEVAPLEDRRPVDDAPGELDQPHDRKRRHRLAAAGLAHDAEHRSPLDGEGHTVDRAHFALARPEIRVEVVDGQQGHQHALRGARSSLGCISRSPSYGGRARRAGRRRRRTR